MREPCWKAPYQYPDARQIGGCPCQPAVCKGRCRGASPARRACDNVGFQTSWNCAKSLV